MTTNAQSTTGTASQVGPPARLQQGAMRRPRRRTPRDLPQQAANVRPTVAALAMPRGLPLRRGPRLGHGEYVHQARPHSVVQTATVNSQLHPATTTMMRVMRVLRAQRGPAQSGWCSWCPSAGRMEVVCTTSSVTRRKAATRCIPATFQREFRAFYSNGAGLKP